MVYERKTKDVHGRGPSNLNLGLFVCSFALIQFLVSEIKNGENGEKPEENNAISSTTVRIGYAKGTCLGHNAATHLH